jgi:hypothetical protein
MYPRCTVCGYDAAGLPEHARCPECGSPAVDRYRRRRRDSASGLPLAPYAVLPAVAAARGVGRTIEDSAGFVFDGALVALLASILIAVLLRVIPAMRWRSTTEGTWSAVFLGIGVVSLECLVAGCFRVRAP